MNQEEPVVMFRRSEYVQILLDAGIPKEQAEREADELYSELLTQEAK